VGIGAGLYMNDVVKKAPSSFVQCEVVGSQMCWMVFSHVI